MKSRTFHYLAIAGAILVLTSAVVLLALDPSSITVERVTFKGATGEIVADVFRPPEGSRTNIPTGVLICHGVENNKEVSAHLAIEFARRGHVSMAFDYGGYGESAPHDDNPEIMVADTLAALTYLAKIPGVSHRWLAMVGHSMGVSYAVDSAERVGPGVRAVVGLGNEAVTIGDSPRNLLLAMGLYDAFHTVDDMLAAVRESSRVPTLEPYEIAGSIDAGDARSLHVSAISEHGMEPLDPRLIAQSIRWIEASFGLGAFDDIKVDVRETYRAEARLLFLVALGMLLTALLVIFYTRPAMVERFPLTSRLPFAVIAACAVLGNLSGPGAALWLADLTIILLGSSSVAAHLARSSMDDTGNGAPSATRRLAFGWAFIGAGALALLSGLLVHGVPIAFTRWEWAKGIPLFVFHVLLLRPYEGLCMLRAYAFTKYSMGWVPEIWFAAAMLIEIVRPGAFAWFAGKVAETLVRAFKLKGPFKMGASGKSYIALGGAIAALLIVLLQRLREGWLSGEAIRRMLLISVKFLILPLLIFIALLNLPFFSRNIGKKS